MRRALLLVLLFPLLPALAVPSPAFACSCAMFTPREYVDNAGLAAAGALASTSSTPANSEGIVSTVDPTTYTVGVRATYKGEETSRVTFTSARFGASCGVEGLKAGRQYVYFLDFKGGSYTANLCNGTGHVPEARVAKVTGTSEAAPPGSPVVIDRDEPAQNAYPWLLPSLGAGALVALGAGLLFVRRRRGVRACGT